MGNNQSELLYSAIEASDEELVANLIKENPNLLNHPITNDCFSTAVGRAAYRGDMKIVQLLVKLGGDLNYAGPNSLTPLMLACMKQQHIVIKYLIENKVNLYPKSKENFNALEYSIIYGSYITALHLIQQDEGLIKTIQDPQIYEEYNKTKFILYVNYQIMIENLKKKVPVNLIPDIYKRPEKPKIIDPVIDPRETWGQFFKRHLEFEEPPMCERSDLPSELQPQNRLLGKIRHYMNGLSPYSVVITQQQQSNQKQQQQHEKKLQEEEEQIKLQQKDQKEQNIGVQTQNEMDKNIELQNPNKKTELIVSDIQIDDKVNDSLQKK